MALRPDDLPRRSTSPPRCSRRRRRSTRVVASPCVYGPRPTGRHTGGYRIEALAPPRPPVHQERSTEAAEARGLQLRLAASSRLVDPPARSGRPVYGDHRVSVLGAEGPSLLDRRHRVTSLLRIPRVPAQRHYVRHVGVGRWPTDPGTDRATTTALVVNQGTQQRRTVVVKRVTPPTPAETIWPEAAGTVWPW